MARRTAAYYWRLRLSDGGTLTAIGGHHHPRYLSAALASLGQLFAGKL